MTYIIGGGGKLSGGKTVTFVKFCVDMHKQGWKIVTNVKLKGIDHVYMSSEELISFIKDNMDNQNQMEEMFYHSVLFIDEARNLFSARKSSTNLNEMMTQFIMMLGKLSCHFLYTFQVWTSMIDTQLREITHLILDMQRLDKHGKPLIADRIIKDKIYIRVKIYIPERDQLINTGKSFVYDPSDYFKYYNTREIVLVDRDKYLRR